MIIKLIKNFYDFIYKNFSYYFDNKQSFYISFLNLDNNLPFKKWYNYFTRFFLFSVLLVFFLNFYYSKTLLFVILKLLVLSMIVGISFWRLNIGYNFYINHVFDKNYNKYFFIIIFSLEFLFYIFILFFSFYRITYITFIGLELVDSW